MTFLIPEIVAWLVRKGIPARWVKPLLGLIALLALAGALWAAIAYHDHNVVTNHDATANAKVIEKTAPANDRASNQRATDTITNARQEQEMHDAIHATPDTAPAPSSLVLGCERLRRQGKSLAGIPACARYSGSH
jgi:hypothetical protein